MGSDRRMCFETECVMALQGHQRSLILAAIESAYVVINSNLGLRDIAGFVRRAAPPYYTRILGVFPSD